MNTTHSTVWLISEKSEDWKLHFVVDCGASLSKPPQPTPVCDKSEKWEKLTNNRRGQGLGITANVDIRQVWEMGETNQRNGSNWPIIIGNLGFTTNVDIRWDLAISVPRIGWKPLRVAITSKKLEVSSEVGIFVVAGQSADSRRYYRALLSQN